MFLWDDFQSAVKWAAIRKVMHEEVATLHRLHGGTNSLSEWVDGPKILVVGLPWRWPLRRDPLPASYDPQGAWISSRRIPPRYVLADVSFTEARA